ncbi:MAG: hypothetical protein HKN85_06570, partial [Gammaproteobacteria bacterium]|nr:hypothetical protein [Gammaproteobacteria bacterium]
AGFRRVAIERDQGSKLELGSVNGPALVMVNDYNYPGWVAKDQISGEEFDISRANNLFRAIYLPAHQEYKLTLAYRPWWLNMVYALLVLAIGITIAVWRWLGTNKRGGMRSPFFS